MSAQPILEASGLVKRYGQVIALNGADQPGSRAPWAKRTSAEVFPAANGVPVRV